MVYDFLYSDGDALFARGDRRKHAVASRVSVEGADQTITVVASVPLTDGPWQPLGEGEVIAMSGGQVLLRNHPPRRA